MANSNNLIIGSAEVSVASTNIGYTSGPTTITYEPEVLEMGAEQAGGTVRVARTNEKMMCKFTLQELTLANLRWALMLPAANLVGSTLTLGYNGACWTDEVVVEFVSVAPSCGVRTWNFPRAVTISPKTYTMSKSEQSLFEVEFILLKDASGNFGTAVDS